MLYRYHLHNFQFLIKFILIFFPHDYLSSSLQHLNLQPTNIYSIYWFIFSLLQIWKYQLQQRVTDWQFGQVALLSGTRFQVVIEGTSYNGGFTLDDFKLYDGACASKYNFLCFVDRQNNKYMHSSFHFFILLKVENFSHHKLNEKLQILFVLCSTAQLFAFHNTLLVLNLLKFVDTVILQ